MISYNGNTNLNVIKANLGVGLLNPTSSVNPQCDLVYYIPSVVDSKLYNGEPCKLYKSKCDGRIVVDNLVANDEASYGVVGYKFVTNEYIGSYNKRLEAYFKGIITILTDDTTITVGDALEFDVATRKYIKQSTGKRVGYARANVVATETILEMNIDLEV